MEVSKEHNKHLFRGYHGPNMVASNLHLNLTIHHEPGSHSPLYFMGKETRAQKD